MPEDGQLKLNTGKDYQSPVSDYAGAAAHEMGHILGLGDAYYEDSTGTSRLVENAETCIFADGTYENMMKSSFLDFTANDFEMMLKAYQEDGTGKAVTQYYRTAGSTRISHVIAAKK